MGCTVNSLLCDVNFKFFIYLFSKEHLSHCAYQEVQCPNTGCPTKLLSRNVKEHVEQDCLYKKTACQWCGVSISKAEQQVSRLGL